MPAIKSAEIAKGFRVTQTHRAGRRGGTVAPLVTATSSQHTGLKCSAVFSPLIRWRVAARSHDDAAKLPCRLAPGLAAMPIAQSHGTRRAPRRAPKRWAGALAVRAVDTGVTQAPPRPLTRSALLARRAGLTLSAANHSIQAPVSALLSAAGRRRSEASGASSSCCTGA